MRCWNPHTGHILWQLDLGLSYYNQVVPGIITSRTTPVPWKNYVIIGTTNNFTTNLPIGTGVADLIAIRKTDGQLAWIYKADDHISAIITLSGNVHKGVFYSGVSSIESILAAEPGYPCCSFVGSAFALRLHDTNPTLIWKTYTIDKSLVGVGKLSGCSVWGSSPSVSDRYSLVFYGTGNNFQAPEAYQQCIMEQPASECNELFGYTNRNWVDSVLALNLYTGAVVWGRIFTPYDAWNVACVTNPTNPNCPTVIGPDADFGMAPTLDCVCSENIGGKYFVSRDHYECDLKELEAGEYDSEDYYHCVQTLYVAQKNGVAYSLTAQNGGLIWAQALAPGGLLGGFSWGIAIDKENVYLSVINDRREAWVLKNCSTTHGGGWMAVSKRDGNVLWTTSNPANYDPSGPPGDPLSNGRSTTSYGNGPPALIGEIMLVCSADTVYVPDLGSGNARYGSGGYCYELYKVDGSILSSYQTGGTVWGGYGVSDGCACVGSGYGRYPLIELSRNYYYFCWCP